MRAAHVACLLLSVASAACSRIVGAAPDGEFEVRTAASSVEVPGGRMLLRLYCTGDPQAEMEAFERWTTRTLRREWTPGQSWSADYNEDGHHDHVISSKEGRVLVGWAFLGEFEPLNSIGLMDDLDGDGVGEVRVNSESGEHHMLYSWSGAVTPVE